MTRAAGAKGVKGPATPSLSVGWSLRFFWSSSGKEFVGKVLDYNAQNKHHTVKWENGPDGRTGVTATNLKEGVVTWLSAPEHDADAHLTPGAMASPVERPGAAGGSSQKKKKQKLASALAASGKKKPPEKKPTEKAARPRSSETLEEVEKRIGAGTIKGICFQVLKDAGPTGLLLSEIVAQTKARGLKDWDSVNQPSNTVNACCSGDPAFVKVAPGRVGLACLGAVESPDLAAQEEREHGEKVLYCEACRGGPFNTKGMRMHISRWCAFAKGNARGHEGITPRAVTDKVAAAADLAASRRAVTNRAAGKAGAGPSGGAGGSGSAKRHEEAAREPRTITCALCGAGPFNEKGAAMHSSRWCRAAGGAGAGAGSGAAPLAGGGGFGSPLDGGFAGLFRGVGGLGAGSGGLGATLGFGLGSELSGLGGGSLGGVSRDASKPGGKKRKAEESSGLMLPPSPPSMMRGAGSFSTGMDLAAMFGNLAGVPATGAGGTAAGPAGGGFARGLIDYMARTFSGGAFSGGLSGGVLGGGGDRVKATAEQDAPVELKIDVNVYKEDGTFVAKAPLAVTSSVTLGGVKDAVAMNTNGALPPNRQRLKHGGSYLPRDDERLLRDFVDVKKSGGKVSMDLTILHEA